MSWPHHSTDLGLVVTLVISLVNVDMLIPCCTVFRLYYTRLYCSCSTPRTTFCKQLCGRCGRQGPCRHAASQSKRNIKSIVMIVHDDPVWPFGRQFCWNLSKTIQFRNKPDIFILVASDSKWVNSEWVVQALALILCCMHAAIQIIANPSNRMSFLIFFWMFVQSFQAVPGPHTWISRFASTPVQGWSLLITGTHGFIMVLESCTEMGIGKIWRCLMFEAESSRDGNLPWSAFKQTLRYSDTHFLKTKTKHFENLG